MNTLLLSSLLLVAAADEPPKPKVPVGKDTTYVTGPLDKNGYIDFEAALNERLGKGISPEKNANVLLWAAFGPTPVNAERQPAEYFKLLGMKEPPKEGDYFVDVDHFAKRQKLKIDERELYRHTKYATQRPWAAGDYPHLAEWLKVNEKPLAVVIEATKRPEYFNPLVSHRKDGEPHLLIGAMLPSMNGCRSASEALVMRAMLRTSEGQYEAAWEDLLACHRLARHVARGATLIELMTAYAIHRTAVVATLAYLERADLASKQVLVRLKELQNLPPLAPAADKIDLGDRLICLDSLQFTLYGRGQKLKARDLQALASIEREAIFREANKLYDRIATTMRMKDRAAREKEFDKIDGEIKARRVPNADALLQKLEQGMVGEELGRQIGNVLISLFLPSFQKCQHAYDRALQVERNLHVAFALAADHKDNGKYPARLAELAPKYTAAVPDDLCNGKPLVYKLTEKGYFFYSVGVNGEDDGGRGETDEPRGDDLGVRMPLPELKKNK